ncbi:hypothetical protein [Paenibacillus aestuarii]|uniref:DUF4025 domain-containing protein n=1 Tax=Paenibacillus aestuarii TaxID=516965 RepID=A0ABW0K3B6_9BACL|nr:hypothetical protein [Paenibacillus aestuarii]
MNQKELHQKLGRPESWALANTTETEQTDTEIPSNYQAMGESYSDTTNFEVNKDPGRLN